MEHILETIRNYNMIRQGMHVLAGVSGGADSVCLLYALAEYGKTCPFELIVVHVEHGIRGKESCEDAEFVVGLCRKLGILCRVETCDAAGFAGKNGLSLEEAARILRYQIFERVRLECGADVIAVAHNENDQAETVLWNLIRGSGLKGLGGMQPIRERIIRPLLFTSRERIEQILGEKGIPYRTDRTNLETEYTRNRIRLEVLPYLTAHLNRRAAEHIAETSEHLREVQAYLEKQTRQAAGRCIVRQGGRIILRIPEFENEDTYLQGELLRECIAGCRPDGLKDIGRKHIEMLRKLAAMPCGKQQDLPGGIVAVRQRETVVFRNRNRSGAEDGSCRNEAYGKKRRGNVTAGGVPQMKAENLPGGKQQAEEKRWRQEYPVTEDGLTELPGMHVLTEHVSRKNIDMKEILTENKYTKWLACDTINRNVCFRTRRSGDYLVVNAAGGRKKLKDYLIDCKIPKEERDKLWLLADGSHILWVIGCRISEAVKVGEETEELLKITIKIRTEEDAV